MVKEVNMDTSSTIKRLLGEYEKIRMENQREGQRRERKSVRVSRRLRHCWRRGATV